MKFICINKRYTQSFQYSTCMTVANCVTVLLNYIFITGLASRLPSRPILPVLMMT